VVAAPERESAQALKRIAREVRTALQPRRA